MLRFNARELSRIGMGAALTAVCSWISVPAAIPFTLQTFAVCLTSALLGLKEGLACTSAYLILGAAGLPVFSGFRGGPGVLLGVTGGYLAGFLFTAAAVGGTVRKYGRSLPAMLVSMAGGILLCYAFGTAWFMAVYARNTGPVSLGSALGMCVVPYLVPDGIKMALAALTVRRLGPALRGNLPPAGRDRKKPSGTGTEEQPAPPDSRRAGALTGKRTWKPSASERTGNDRRAGWWSGRRR